MALGFLNSSREMLGASLQDCMQSRYCLIYRTFIHVLWELWWLMVSALDSGASGPGSSPGRGQCVVFLGKTLYSHSASLHPGV